MCVCVCVCVRRCGGGGQQRQRNERDAGARASRTPSVSVKLSADQETLKPALKSSAARAVVRLNGSCGSAVSSCPPTETSAVIPRNRDAVAGAATSGDWRIGAASTDPAWLSDRPAPNEGWGGRL